VVGIDVGLILLWFYIGCCFGIVILVIAMDLIWTIVVVRTGILKPTAVRKSNRVRCEPEWWTRECCSCGSGTRVSW